MSDVVAVPLDDGGSLMVEIGDDAPVIEQVGREDALHQAGETWQAALGKVRPAVDAVITQLGAAASPPDEVSVEFGIKVTTEAGVVIAKAAAEANFTVSALWKRPPVE